MKNLLLIFLLSVSFTFAQTNNRSLAPSSNGELVDHTYYSLSYIEEHEQAEWVYYVLTPALVSGEAERGDNFRADAKVKSGSASPSDYTSSGFDRGHLCPAGSMTLNEDSMSESFYMSNMSPQEPSFNRGGWKKLEDLVRKWTLKDSLLHVVSGPLLTKDRAQIGKNKVTIPAYFYKVIYSPSKAEMIAFLMPNKKIENPLESYALSVDLLEQKTNIDFFAPLESDQQTKLEASKNLSAWNFDAKAAASPKSSISSTSKSANSISQSLQCKGISKSSGKRCRNTTKNANGYCSHHQSQSK